MKRRSKGLIRDAVSALRRYRGGLHTLSAAAGVHINTLYKWRRGATKPSPEMAMRLERAIGGILGLPVLSSAKQDEAWWIIGRVRALEARVGQLEKYLSESATLSPAGEESLFAPDYRKKKTGGCPAGLDESGSLFPRGSDGKYTDSP